MLPQVPHFFDFIHVKEKKDLPHLALVSLMVFGIIIGVYLSMQPQIFKKQAAEGSLVDLAFVPETIQIQTGKVYEARVAINPKVERVTAVQLALEYDPAVITIIETKNEGFLPVTLKTSDDFNGNLNLTYGSTIDTQTNEPGVVASIKFKANSGQPSRITMKRNTQVSIASKDGNALTSYPALELQTGTGGGTGEEDTRYPDSLLLEKVFHPEAEPFIRDFREALEPKPEVKPERVDPEFSATYAKQLGRDIFIEPVAALNQVLQETATGILKPGDK